MCHRALMLTGDGLKRLLGEFSRMVAKNGAERQEKDVEYREWIEKVLVERLGCPGG